MKAAIIGYATEGKVSAQYWHDKGYEITVCKRSANVTLPEDYHLRTGKDYLNNLEEFDVIVRTAGIHPRILLADNPGVAPKITSSIQEFMRVCPSKNIIGVTGTKGKGTTSTLIYKMLKQAGIKAHLGGNIGIAALSLLPSIQPDDWVVLELSSFQLEDFKGPSPSTAVCLMVVPEHLNWHATYEEYIAAKSKLFTFQKPGDRAIYYAESDASHAIVQPSQGSHIPFYKEPGAHITSDHNNQTFIEIDGTRVCATNEIALKGRHNWQNACAAVTAVWPIIQNASPLATVLKTFTGLEHRIENAGHINGVDYYDDSFATTPETAIAAIESFDQPKVVILGGSDKGIPFDELTATASRSGVRHAIVIGDTAPVIASQLRANGFTSITEGLKTMKDIVKEAQRVAQPGDVVLLSTGCASFGLFKDYKDRGNQFKQEVQSLSEVAE